MKTNKLNSREKAEAARIAASLISNGMTYEEIGEKVGLVRQTVSSRMSTGLWKRSELIALRSI